jgi:hypothetical protein
LTHLEQLMSIPMRRQNDLPGRDLIEQIMPGSAALNDERDDRIEATMNREREKARASVATALTAAAKPELIEHWRSLGGFVPSQP